MRDDRMPISTLQTMQTLLLNDLRFRLKKWASLDVLPSEVQYIANQEHTGKAQDINVSPTPDVHDMSWRILSHPTKDSMLHFIHLGKTMVWPHMKRIQMQMQLEHSLERSAAALLPRTRLAETRGDPLRARAERALSGLAPKEQCETGDRKNRMLTRSAWKMGRS